MKIQTITNIYNSFNNWNINKTSPKYINNKQNMASDIVSFSAKKYDISSIINPTNHCAYCGCKVYTEQQIDSMAKYMLASKYGRLDGEIKSVLEKLEDAKRSQEIASAKKIENKEEIDFFKNFMKNSSAKPYLKGQAVFEEVYGIEKEEALELLKKNMRPLLQTVDHVSPQNENMENKNSDVNLVEACYCCNHDLKKGSSFGEFYTMFPSIRNNMPKEKFEYAFSNLLGSSQEVVSQRLSAANMLKMLERLFVQKKETSDYLESINYRIQGCKAGIIESIKSCEANISSNQAEIADLQNKFEELNKDPEYAAMIRREQLLSQINSIKDVISSLSIKRKKSSDSINELNNPKSVKKNQQPLEPEEKEAKIKTLKDELYAYGEQIAQQEERQVQLELELHELNEEFPAAEVIQRQKSEAENIYNAHLSLRQTKSALDKKKEESDLLTEKEVSLKSQISEISQEDISFAQDSYSEEKQALFERYKSLKEALTYIEEHHNIGTMKVLINNAAKNPIKEEIQTLEREDIVDDYIKCLTRDKLKAELEKVNKEKSKVQSDIESMEKECSSYSQISAKMTLEDAQSQIKLCSAHLKSLREKELLCSIPKKINALNAEITLLNQTIKDLKSKLEEIDL
ncbi:MAG: hypothetical protein LUH05_08475 [Candidatus Gastranaerophilales bacterium]|nr:hypothetical protein [Candidatus Gastranaerophilales bacterium]